MTVFRASVVVHSTDRQSALYRYEQLFAAHPQDEFQIPGRDLVVSVFTGFSVLSGSPEALAPMRDLRATLFVDSLKEIEDLLVETGWTREGTLGSKGSVLARDSDGNLIEFIEVPRNRGSQEPAKKILPDRVARKFRRDLMPESEEDEVKIIVSKNGPYIVKGSVPLSVKIIAPNKEGLSWEWKEAKEFETPKTGYVLCRCGHSNQKPFCDGTHAKIGFDGTETATRKPYVRQAEVFDGPTMTLSDAESLCAFARFCDPGGKIWNLIEHTDDSKARDLVIREANHCPAGRLVVHDKNTDEEIEHDLPKSIGVVEDPALECSGPLWVRGGVRVESQNGKPYETRNRVTLCRCGASSNMPFCNGSHASIKFSDGLFEDGGKD